MNDRGWTSSRSEALQLQILDWLGEVTKNGLLPTLDGFLTDKAAGVSEEEVKAAASALSNHGLISTQRTLADDLESTSAYLTDAGKEVLSIRGERRRVPRLRAVACREALLDWFYEQKRHGSESPITENFLEDVRGAFEGDPFTEKEMYDASEYLKDKALIGGIGSWGPGVIRGHIESLGEDVVENYEGSISKWSMPQASTTHFTTHFNGAVSGMVGIGETVSQTQNQTSGIDQETFLALVLDVQEAAQEASDADRRFLLTYLDTVQAEVVSAEPDKTMIKGSGDRLKQIAGKAGLAGLTASVGTLVKFVFAHFGIA